MWFSLKSTFGLCRNKCLPLSDFSHISCHLTYPDFFAASFTSPNDITGGKLPFSLASWAASLANLSACSLPLMFACPGVHEISMVTYVGLFQLFNYIFYFKLGLPRLRNLVNVYTSSSNRSDRIYTSLPDCFFFSLCNSVKSPIFSLKTLWKMYLVRIFEIVSGWVFW